MDPKYECMKHAGREASWYCPECEATLCDPCLAEIVIGAPVGPQPCPYCGGRLRKPGQRDDQFQQVQPARSSQVPPARQAPPPGPMSPSQPTSRSQHVYLPGTPPPPPPSPFVGDGPPPMPGGQPGQPPLPGQENLPAYPSRHAKPGSGNPEEFLTAAAYPFRGRGLFILLGGTVLFMFLGLAQCIPSIFSLIVAIGVMGYLASYLMKIVNTSASGDPEPPDWPDVHHLYEDIFVPFFRWIGCMFIAFLPLTILFIMNVSADVADKPPMIALSPLGTAILLVVGAAYLPMAMLAVSLWDSVAAAGPQRVLPAIMRLGAPYLLVVAILAVVLVLFQLVETGLQVAVTAAFGELLGLAFAYTIGGFFSLYSAMVVGRILGLTYHVYGDRLKWFD